MAEVDYAVLKPFPVQLPGGERLNLEPGDVVPREVHGRWLFLAQEAGKVAPVTLAVPEKAALGSSGREGVA